MSLFRLNAGTVLDLEPGKQRKASFGWFTIPVAVTYWTCRLLLYLLVLTIKIIQQIILVARGKD